MPWQCCYCAARGVVAAPALRVSITAATTWAPR
jgi:hypothetical protein